MRDPLEHLRAQVRGCRDRRRWLGFWILRPGSIARDELFGFQNDSAHDDAASPDGQVPSPPLHVPRDMFDRAGDLYLDRLARSEPELLRKRLRKDISFDFGGYLHLYGLTDLEAVPQVVVGGTQRFLWERIEVAEEELEELQEIALTRPVPSDEDYELSELVQLDRLERLVTRHLDTE